MEGDSTGLGASIGIDDMLAKYVITNIESMRVYQRMARTSSAFMLPLNRPVSLSPNWSIKVSMICY
jgi:hypothetical protein